VVIVSLGFTIGAAFDVTVDDVNNDNGNGNAREGGKDGKISLVVTVNLETGVGNGNKSSINVGFEMTGGAGC
jgi:hypothetical protein